MTRLHHSLLARPLLSAFLVAAMGAPALAQPVDDPGMATDAPPPAAPPLVAPPTATPRPAAPSSTPPPVATTAVIASPAPVVTETTDEKVTYEAGSGKKETGIEFYDRLATATAGGPIGLLRTLTGDVGRPASFRVSMNFGLFKADSFLIKGNSTIPGDTNSRFQGDITVSYTPWKYLELYAALFNQSNKNERTDVGRTDPEVILSLGDFAFGLKGRIPVHRALDLGLHAGVRFLNSVSGVSFDGKSTNFNVDLIASFDVRKIDARIPLRFHFNAGYMLDNSLHLLPDNQCATSTGNDACIRSRVVETFAYGLGTSRLKFALAADVPLLLGPVGLQPFFEYHADVAVGSGDDTVNRTLSNDPNVSNDRLTSRSYQYLTIGARVRPVAGLILTAAVDVGLTSQGFIYGPPTAPWNVVLGLAYAYDASSRKNQTKVVTRTTVRMSTAVAIPEGRLRGVVRDAATKKGISLALVKYPTTAFTPQSTTEDGTFLSYGLPAGPTTVEVTCEGYEPQKVMLDIRAATETPVEVLLTAKPPEAGTVKVHVADEAGQPVAATVRFVSSKGPVVDADAEPTGGYTARLPGGDYTVEVVANGFLSRPRSFQVVAGQVQSLDVALRKKPKVSHVAILKGEIVLKGVIHFATNDTEIRLDSRELLDEVVDILVASPQVKRVRIEGHTDNKGDASKNLELSKGRARAVMAYLIQQGIDATRLESEGYGASQPLVPNITTANRAKNRRVAFKIVE